MYSMNSFLLGGVLLLLILVVNEIGYRLGRWWQSRTDEEIKEQTTAIQASILGLLALLLGFTFTMALQRYDNRAEAMLAEANAIGTAQLRAQLLPSEMRQPAEDLFNHYVSLRVESGLHSTVQEDQRETLRAKEQQVIQQFWGVAIRSVDMDPRPVTSGLFVQALNDMFDARDKRSALLARHVPEVVLYLLVVVFIATCGFLGYSSGIKGRRPYVSTSMLASIIALVMFIVIDLDRPRRGYIQVDQTALQNLLASEKPLEIHEP